MRLIWYFDFISPFAYLQLQRFGELPDSVEIECKPILLAGLLNHWQNVGPAEIPPKRIFTYQYCNWLATKAGITFNMPPAHPFNSLKALRLAIATGNELSKIHHLFNVIWQQGLGLESPAVDAYLKEMLNITDVDELVSQPAVKQKLLQNTQQAAANQVFGVPTFMVENDPQAYFWGLDAFDMLLDYLAQPQSFYDNEMQRIASLPEGVQRKRKLV